LIGDADPVPTLEEGFMQSTFHIGQLVRIKDGADKGKGRTYCVVDIVPGVKGSPTYLIKAMTGAERIVRPTDIKSASAHALP
jgi:hypothetical protein